MSFQETMDKLKTFLSTRLDEVIYGLIVLGLASMFLYLDKLGAELWVVVALGIPALWGGKAVVSGLAQASTAKAQIKAFVAGTQPPEDPPPPEA